ncbi:MAG: Microtubule-nucleating Tub4p (gamma-tubulin) complex component [Trizodia sp. TS-e1964]|nr:MAG: Microtubule-nucleating Tub4p (gamma-tubulin) complex component [Trizodia sp. TS-e1964]
MAQSREQQRISDAVSSLIETILPQQSDDAEDDDRADERHARYLRRAMQILDGGASPGVVSDVNHASDLIKRKLIRENSSPDKALRFSNLYSRLLVQPLLSQKWAILYLLHQLADSHNVGIEGPSRLEGGKSSVGGQETLPQSLSKAGSGSEVGDEAAFSEAFSVKGLQPIPANAPQRNREEVEEEFGKLPGNLKTKSAGISSKTSLLSECHPALNPSEFALLRDLPFTLQGLSSSTLTFHSVSVLNLPPTLPSPMISLLHSLAEPSLLYNGLSAYVNSSEGGLVSQSLKAAMSKELRSYLGLIATLEGEIRRALSMIDEDKPRGGIGKAGVTLRRCIVWTREATMGLRLMSAMAEGSKNKKGGQLISMIHSFATTHGDPFVGAFAERLLSHITKPFYNMLRQWIYDGELSDPYLEFFVSEQTPADQAEALADGRSRGGATSVWEDKYKLDNDMIPSIITQDFSKKVFLIGKSLNFIRYGCGDSPWVEAHSKDKTKELKYGDTATLETSIDEAYKTTMTRLIQLMADKFHFFDHLKALKKYLLLGQGDFIALLMESLSSDLQRPANSLQRHNLTAKLEYAIRGSNAQYDSPEVLRRLDARMLMESHGEIGWECFTLEYKIDAPVDVIITPWGSRQYLKVFNFLWSVKRVEFALGSTWRRCMTGARGVLNSVEETLGRDWKKARCCVAEMIHFVCQLQYYILFEVIESSWDALQVSISKPECTLDDLIEAHTKYLNAITRKGLLGSSRTRGSHHHRDDDFMTQLHEILKIMLGYKEVVDGLYSFSVAEFTRRQEISAKIETQTAHGKWGVAEQDEDDTSGQGLPNVNTAPRRGAGHKHFLSDSAANTPLLPTQRSSAIDSADDQMLPSLRARLNSLETDFKARVNILLGDLAYQPDVDMRFLGVVMNFNNVYEPVKPKRAHRSSQAVKKERKTPGVQAATMGAGKMAEQQLLVPPQPNGKEPSVASSLSK